MEKEIADIETNLLLEAIYQRYGYDFRQYRIDSIKKRFELQLKKNSKETISDLIPKVLYDRNFFRKVFLGISVSVSEMFRSPLFFSSVKQHVIPLLKTYPCLNIWHAGCASGEEAYSMAILLKEEGLLDRSQIYATDINDASLNKAREGVFPLKEMQFFARNYNHAGGRGSFIDYFKIKGDRAKINDTFRKNITFLNHNLVADAVFAEMHLIVCKNVLVYFNEKLHDKVLRLLTDSLRYSGFLCPGSNDSLEGTCVSDQFEVIDKETGIYKKKYPLM